MAESLPQRDLTPQRIVHELDRHIVGQAAAKRAIALALRARFRRKQLPIDVGREITPKNIILIGPTGVGKTEIARRMAKLIDAPFLKTDATKFTEVGYVGRDVDSIARDLMDTAVAMVHEARLAEVQEQARALAEERIIAALLAKQGPRREPPADETPAELHGQDAPRREQARQKRRRRAIAAALNASQLEEQIIEIETDGEEAYPPIFEFFSGVSPEEISDSIQDLMSQAAKGQHRARRVSVKEARRILTTEEAGKMVDWDEVIEQATRRVEEDGVVFIDEFDKIARGGAEAGVDVSGEGVQRDLLPIVEGTTVMTRYGPIKTDHILFVAAGAFHKTRPADLIPELQGRFPVRVELEPLSEEDFVRILREPEHSLTSQYQALMSVEGVELQFTEDGLAAIAHVAVLANERTENIGARRLHTVLERVLEELSFDASSRAGDRVIVDREYVQARLSDLLRDPKTRGYVL